MSKRFYSFNSIEPAKKRSSPYAFLPWKEPDMICDQTKNGNIKSGILHLLSLNVGVSSVNVMLKIVLKHQLYSLMDDRTIVDRGINDMLQKGEIKVFKTSLGNEQPCIMLTSDYVDHVRSTYDKISDKSATVDSVVNKFLDIVVPTLKDISINEDVLIAHHGFKDKDVTELIKAGILTVKNAGSWWLAVPNVGTFLKTLRKGRQIILQTLKRAKYKEMNKDTLTSKKTLPSLKFNIEYQLHDLIGADLVNSIQSTTGTILRLADSTSK